jgi:arylsulfatase A-like enzyme
MTKANNNGKPFFLNMAHYTVHTPIEAHKRLVKHYQNRIYQDTQINIPEVEKNYASLVEGMDDSLGALMKHLNVLGIAENTLVIFTSDNGGLSGHTRETKPRGTELNSHHWPLNAGKGSAFEGGTRVPYIVAWAKPQANNPVQKSLPDAINKASSQQIMIEDLFPTLLSVAQGENNIPVDHQLDGINSRQFWSNTELNVQRRVVFHYPHVWGPHGPGYEPHSAMRMGDLKVIYLYYSRTWLLFDLATDLSEQYNLAKRQPEKLKKWLSSKKRVVIGGCAMAS